MMKEGISEGVWKEVWRDPASAKNETQPKPIRGYLRNPDFRSGRDPLTGRTVSIYYSTVKFTPHFRAMRQSMKHGSESKL